MLDIESYFDDGGSDEGSSVAVLAGYIGPKLEWECLEEKWKAVLLREKITFYHSVDCAQGVKQFDGWCKDRRNVLHREMVELITGRRLVALGAGVVTRGFKKAYADFRPVGMRPVPKPQYHYCVFDALKYVGQYMETRVPDEKVTIVFEETPKVMGRAVEMYETFCAGEGKHLRQYFAGPPTFRSKVGYPQLQAADVLAYEMGLDARRSRQDERHYPLRRSWLALMNHAAEQGNGLEVIKLKDYLYPDDAWTPNQS